jgi:hypothetical protein
MNEPGEYYVNVRRQIQKKILCDLTYIWNKRYRNKVEQLPRA